MDDKDREFLDSYWVDQRSTLEARTMTQILDRIGRLKRALTPGRIQPATFYERAFTSQEILDLLGNCGLANARVFPAGVVPPYIPLLYRSQRFREAQVWLVERTQRLWKSCD